MRSAVVLSHRNEQSVSRLRPGNMDDIELKDANQPKIKDELEKEVLKNKINSNEYNALTEELMHKEHIKPLNLAFDDFDEANGEMAVVDPSSNKMPLAHSYAAKKTVAQGMMDVALITANANQLKFVLNSSVNSPTFYLVVVLIVISLLLQIAVGVSLIFKGRADLKGESKLEHANRINNYVVVGVFLITIINVFIAAFSDSGPGALRATS